MSNLPVAIMAGGHSRRMGQDKGFLDLNGHPIIQHIIDLASQVSSDVFIVSDLPQYARLDQLCIPDIFPDHGPLGGIYTALDHVTSQKILVLSCDAPLLNVAALQHLIDKSSDCDAAIASHQERLHPLLGVYDKACAPIFKQLLQVNELRLLDALAKVKSKSIVYNSELPFYHSDLFLNVNTPESYQELLDKMR